MSLPKTIFLGLANSAPCYYRCCLPAEALEAHWVGVSWAGDFNAEIMYNGNLGELPNYSDYEVVIIQQPHGEIWDAVIQKLQSEGIKVVFEVDDFIHGVTRIKDHAQRDRFNKKVVKQFQKTMSLCDAMICSTDYLSSQYSKYNDNQYVCRNGIETERYAVEFPERDKYIIGWAGGTGHDQAVIPWLTPVADLVRLYDDVYFMSLGEGYGDPMKDAVKGKSSTAPWVSIENLPYCLTNLDAYIAPMHDSKYFKSKSNLRWLEASAVGLPGVVHPQNYFDAVDGETAIFATTPQEAGDGLQELIEDRELGRKIGKQAQTYVRENFDISVMSQAWRKAIEDIAQKQ